jgi:hypothetical protein
MFGKYELIQYIWGVGTMKVDQKAQDWKNKLGSDWMNLNLNFIL